MDAATAILQETDIDKTSVDDFVKIVKDALKRYEPKSTRHKRSEAKGQETKVTADEANAKQVKGLSQYGTIWHAVSAYGSDEGKESWKNVQAAVELMTQKTEHKDVDRLDELVPWMRGDDLGFFGETPLHVLLVFNDFNKDRKELIQFFKELWEMCPRLHDLVYTQPLYKGENVLHIAIIKKVPKEVLDVMKGSKSWMSLLEGRATGDFFQNEELSEGTCNILGETPLGFAACTCQPEVFKYLLPDPRTKPDAFLKQITYRTELGNNNLLHLMVLNAFNREEIDGDQDDDDDDDDDDNDESKEVVGASEQSSLERMNFSKDIAEKAYLQMYDYIGRQTNFRPRGRDGDEDYTPLMQAAAHGSLAFFASLMAREKKTVTAEKAYMKMYDVIASLIKRVNENKLAELESKTNKDGYTPLKLAAAEGSPAFFQFLMGKRLSVAWVYGPVTCSKMYLKGVDIPLSDEKIHSGKSHENLSVLEILVRCGRKEIVASRIMDKLVELKWNKYGRRWFYFRSASPRY